MARNVIQVAQCSAALFVAIAQSEAYIEAAPAALS
jgi:hypothetical protein